MIGILKKYIPGGLFTTPVREHDVVEAYDLWAENYDSQPGNLMLDLDKTIFMKLLGNVDLKGKEVADIGCGTGRHWSEIFEKKPAGLTGFDVSPGMLAKLKGKFPAARTHMIVDDQFSLVADSTYDVLVSTLTAAHIENIEGALNSWCRISKANADMIITDFHPDALAVGGKRTFKHHNVRIAVKNFVHTTYAIKNILHKHGLRVVSEEEKIIDQTVRHYYEDQNAQQVYEKFKGIPIIYGIHFRRQ